MNNEVLKQEGLSRRSLLGGFAAIGGVAVAGSVLAACGSDDSGAKASAPAPTFSGAWGDVVKKAYDEGVVTLYYSFTDEQFAVLQKDFQKAYPGIELKGSRQLGSTGAFEKLKTERETGADGADVFFNGGQSWIRQELAADPGRFVSPLLGPNVDKLDDSLIYQDKIVVPLITAIVFGRNTSVVKDPVTTYEGLLDSSLKGKIGLADYAPTTAIAYNYSQIVATFGWDYLEKLAAQKPVFYTGSTVTQALASGEVVVTNYAYAPAFQPLIDGGAPIELSNPTGTSKALGAAINMEILGWAKHKNAAQVLLDFLSTEKGQEPVAAGNVSTAFPSLKGAVDISPDQLWTFQAQTIPDGFEDRWRSIFKR